MTSPAAMRLMGLLVIVGMVAGCGADADTTPEAYTKLVVAAPTMDDAVALRQEQQRVFRAFEDLLADQVSQAYEEPSPDDTPRYVDEAFRPAWGSVDKSRPPWEEPIGPWLLVLSPRGPSLCVPRPTCPRLTDVQPQYLADTMTVRFVDALDPLTDTLLSGVDPWSVIGSDAGGAP